MRGPINSLVSMTSCLPQHRHPAANGSQPRNSEEGNSHCQSVNNTLYYLKLFSDEFLQFSCVFQPNSLLKEKHHFWLFYVPNFPDTLPVRPVPHGLRSILLGNQLSIPSVSQYEQHSSINM